MLSLIVVSNIVVLSLTLVTLVVFYYLMCWLIHIWILLFVIVDHNQWYLNIERSGEGRVVISQRISFVFVSHLTDQLVIILSKCAG